MNHPLSVTYGLWNDILGGDLNAFGSLVELYKNAITAIAFARIGDHAGSEDVAQETFLVAWQSRDQLREPERVGGWLCGIARNLSAQWLRNRNTRPFASSTLEIAEPADNRPSPLEKAIREEEHQLVWRSIEGLDEIYREVIVLFYRQSHSVQQVAEILEINEDTVRQRLSRARNLIRAEVARKVETILESSKPSPQFTAAVMGLLVSSSVAAATKAAASAVATGTTVKAGTSLGGAALGTAGTAGLVGGSLGAIGGLAGAWLGTWLPAQTAPTLSERKVIERYGRNNLILSVFVVLISIFLSVVGFKILPVKVSVAAIVLLWTLFTVMISISILAMNRELKRIRSMFTPENDPNSTWVKERLGVGKSNQFTNWIGRRGTSSLTFMGIPLWDFQVSDPKINFSEEAAPKLHANGWLAVGDRATGFIAIGGRARGAIAFGGMSIGLISFGGLSVGLISLGGCALGLLSIGGLSIGHSALGGGAIGWQTAGGAAIGYHSANGGLAISNSIADGGLAISNKYAVGGNAIAPEANTPAAYQAADQTWAAPYLSAKVVRNNPAKFQRYNIVFTSIIAAASGFFAIITPLVMYQRRPKNGVSLTIGDSK